MDDDYINVTDAAKKAGLDPASLRRKLRRGEVPGAQRMIYGPFSRWLIPRLWAENYIHGKPGRKPRRTKVSGENDD